MTELCDFVRCPSSLNIICFCFALKLQRELAANHANRRERPEKLEIDVTLLRIFLCLFTFFVAIHYAVESWLVV